MPAAVALWCVFSCLAVGEHCPAVRVNPSRRLVAFDIRQRNLIDALLLLGQQEKIPIAIEYINAIAFEKQLTLQLRDQTLQEVLDALTHPFGYRWFTDGRVVTVTHHGALRDKRNLLNTRIPHFRISETEMHQADFALHIGLYFVLNPHSRGIVGDYPGGNFGFRVGPLDMKNGTVREILNCIISQHGNGAWVVQQPPWTMDKDLGYGVWKVLEYDRTDGSYSRELQVRGLGLRAQ